MTTGVGEPVGHRTVGAVDDARRSWVLDAGHGFFIWVNSLRDEPEGLVSRLFTEDLSNNKIVIKEENMEFNRDERT